MMVLLALACADSPAPADPAAYTAALRAVSTDPLSGARACRHLQTRTWRVDCLSAAAEGLARTNPVGAAAICDELPVGLWRDECGFQVAERSGDGRRCASAGRFEMDCRMHLWSRRLMATIPADATPAQVEGPIAQLARQEGFTADDTRPWIAAFRLMGARMRPLDRSSCDGLIAPARRDTCRATFRDLYGDLLNHARDTGTFPCDGEPLPDRITYAPPDPELDAILEERRRRDLCP